MGKNYLLFMPSLMQDGCAPIRYAAADSALTFTGMQTNIPATEYIVAKLAAGGEKLNKIIMLCSDEVLEKQVTPAGASAPVRTYDYYVREVSGWMREYGYTDQELEEMFISCKLRDINPGSYTSMEQFQLSIMQQLQDARGGKLYVDYTGGLRSASMLLIFFARMFEKKLGVTVKRVLYSSIYREENGQRRGQIEDCIDTYSLFDFLDAIGKKDLSAISKEAKKSGNAALAKSAAATQSAKQKADAGSFEGIKKEDKELLASSARMSVKEQLLTDSVNDVRKTTTREGALQDKVKEGNAKEATALIRNSGVKMLRDKGYLIWRSNYYKNDFQINNAFVAYARYYQTYIRFVRGMLLHLQGCASMEEFRKKYEAYLDEHLLLTPAQDIRFFSAPDSLEAEFDSVFGGLVDDLQDTLLQRLQEAGTSKDGVLAAIKDYETEKKQFLKTYCYQGFPFGNILTDRSYSRCGKQWYDREYQNALRRSMSFLMKKPFAELMSLVAAMPDDAKLLTRNFPAVHFYALFDLRDNDFRGFSVNVLLMDSLRKARNQLQHNDNETADVKIADSLILEFATWLQALEKA